MKKTILAIAAAVTIAVGTLSMPNVADARCRGCGLGIFGGLVAGAIIGSAIASHPGYYTYEAYDAPPPMVCPAGGYWARRPVYDGYGNVVGWSRPHYFCR
jgi:hypothetical protein